MPTILALLGLDPPGDVEGSDLSPLLFGEKGTSLMRP